MSTSVNTYLRVNRRKTDLMPTIPSIRDQIYPRPSTTSSSSRTTPFARTPGRAFSMSRLDQLAQPRLRRPLTSTSPSTTSTAILPPVAPLRRGAAHARSMSHLAAQGNELRASDRARSMSQLGPQVQSAPIPPPRMTRAERLRQRAKAHNQGKCSPPFYGYDSFGIIFLRNFLKINLFLRLVYRPLTRSSACCIGNPLFRQL